MNDARCELRLQNRSWSGRRKEAYYITEIKTSSTLDCRFRFCFRYVKGRFDMVIINILEWLAVCQPPSEGGCLIVKADPQDILMQYGLNIKRLLSTISTASDC